MDELIRNLTLTIVAAPLLGSLIVGIGNKRLGRASASAVTILLMLISFLCALYLAKLVFWNGQGFNQVIYNWGTTGAFQFNMGFLIDALSTLMIVIVTFVSLVVHIYSVGYMAEDPGYERFFSYVSFFTFSMLVLVSANNFFQLFFGWEGVGLASYLLIGFWYQKDSAANGGLKALLVNRAGDLGFILGLAAILEYFNTFDYQQVFSQAASIANTTIALAPHWQVSAITVICILLFIGAMAKSAQIPLHVWLPESMEGPTPISALIHAATMVTAGVFMVARASPLFELSPAALSLIMIIGATGALFLGLLAFVENDIKRVIAYSTMSQLGYMMAANGASGFAASIFHLLNHAGFKALLFLSAGSIIIALHHEQDLRKMGNLKKYLPITYVCFLIGALALAAIPPFSGFYSKDSIIEIVHHSQLPGAYYAYLCLLIGAFVTAYYIFRAFILAFHTQEKFNPDLRPHIKEYWVMLIPMILLAIPSTLSGILLVKPFLFEQPGLLGKSITVLPQYNVLKEVFADVNNPWIYALHAVFSLTFWFAIAGIFLAWINYILFPRIPAMLQRRLQFIYFLLKEKYGFDQLNQLIFVRGARAFSNFLFHFGDVKFLDDWIINGSAKLIAYFSSIIRKMQSGYLYHYVLVMIIGVIGFLIWMIV